MTAKSARQLFTYLCVCLFSYLLVLFAGLAVIPTDTPDGAADVRREQCYPSLRFTRPPFCCRLPLPLWVSGGKVSHDFHLEVMEHLNIDSCHWGALGWARLLFTNMP